MDLAQTAPQTAILAEDEASLYLQATLTAVWAPQGQTPVVRVDPSRTKTNFYGSVNLRTGAELVMRAEKMNAQATAIYLEQILQAIPNQPILLLWDRAPWHRGAPIRKVLEANPRLEIMSFPVAAPELNPQEHVWKATRRATGHNHLQPHLPELADRFEQHLVSTTFESTFLDRYGYTAILPMFI
jgi:putative transposase